MKRGMMAAAAKLFAVQASWNYERLQSIGAAVAIEPLLRDLPGGPTGDAYRRAMGRAAGFFNAHPYLAGLAIGAVARAEHSGVAEERVARLRSILKGPLGSIGDRLVWVGILPLTSAAGISLVALGKPLAGVVVFLAMYNVAHVAIRLWALRNGWRLGTSVAKALGHPVLMVAMKYVGPLAAFGIGLAVPLAGAYLTAGFQAGANAGVAAVTVAGIVAFKWFLPHLSASRVGLMAILVALALGTLWR